MRQYNTDYGTLRVEMNGPAEIIVTGTLTLEGGVTALVSRTFRVLDGGDALGWGSGVGLRYAPGKSRVCPHPHEARHVENTVHWAASQFLQDDSFRGEMRRARAAECTMIGSAREKLRQARRDMREAAERLGWDYARVLEACLPALFPDDEATIRTVGDAAPPNPAPAPEKPSVQEMFQDPGWKLAKRASQKGA